MPYNFKLGGNLPLDRCPHCQVALPLLTRVNTFQTSGSAKSSPTFWATYGCTTCASVVLANASTDNGEVKEYWPQNTTVSDAVPERPGEYLKQANESLSQPVGSIMLSASAVDAMLKTRDLKEGSLYKRIDKAAADGLITESMAKWAHQVRLDANDQRHVDEGAPMPGHDDAKLCLDFALALAEALFILPARVTRGIKQSEQ